MTLSIALAASSDQQQWDDFVSTQASASPYHRFAWGQAVSSAYGFTPRYFVAKQDQQIVGILPTIAMAKPLLKNKLCSLPYCDVAGPLATDDKIANELIMSANQYAAQNKLATMQLRRLASHDESEPEQQWQGHKVSMQMALPETSDALLASFKSKLRSQIRKAEKNGLHAETGVSEKLLQDFYEVMLVNMRALGSPIHSYQWFQAIINHYQSQCLLSVVYKDDIAVGGGLILKNGTSAAIPWASTKAEFNRLAPNMLLYWSLLAHCADHGIERFDFGRSTFGEGTFKFKTQWGAKPHLLVWDDYHKGQLAADLPVINKAGADSKLSGMVKSWVVGGWQRLPLQLTGSLGPKLRKYIDL
ncbi:peptidoglycan bridge formation glycyltransferase FemA/FemB family protein [Neiella sp. HB171785]|uniref:Peptidoglycan bridge formation glycyltransferase FemA/FemB family protein n=1 Tax=Neiella litorisoli TaxID=2771431 RepID=A0A8J6UF49_9GAMM|nr:GNAT family N-acetyltransferase [Neiella litorisoli]MBD1390539.1 peptidoglycan bridge formation glycyltransferase FemA/FemB family protein [Neiella litorisoli]